MARLQLKPSVIKKLFALSGNQCTFPGCGQHIVDSSGALIGEICHIEAAEQGGERFNKDSDDEFRRSFENLILLCPIHHKVTNDVKKYTSSKLRKYKSVHEDKFLRKQFSVTDNVVDQAIDKYMEQHNKNEGSGIQFNNQANHQNIGTQIGTQHVHNYNENEFDKPHLDGGRKVIERLKKIIDKNRKQASPPDVTVIDYQNELQEKTPRPVEILPTRMLKFRKDNGRIKADVESFEKANNIILDESDDKTQELLKSFLIKNDPDSNDELKKLLIHKGQKDPAIITCDGFLINGNRRKMALEELFKERNQDSRYEMMRVVILDEGATEIDIQKVENRLQLQGEGKSEYQGLNRALTIRANEQKGFSLEAQLKDDPNYHDLTSAEFKKVVQDFRKKYLMPLECADRYLETFEKPGMYNTISESTGDKEGRWQAFIEYSSFRNAVLENKGKMQEFGINENEKGKIENALFKIIRKRSLNSKELESNIGKLYDFIRKVPKYLKNQEAKSYILKIANEVNEDLPKELKSDKNGEIYDERTIDEKWGLHNQNKILGNLIKAHKIVSYQQESDKPLELLRDALKKLKHENLKIENMHTSYYEKAIKLTKDIMSEAERIFGEIDKARYNLKKLPKKKIN